MKKVVSTNSQTVVEVSNLTWGEDSFIGVVESGGIRSWIESSKFSDGYFVRRSAQVPTIRNTFNTVDEIRANSANLQKLVQGFLDRGKEVYQFESAKELFKWVFEI